MTQISLSQIQQDPAAFLQSVASGESIVISQDDKPIAEVRPIESVEKKKRQFGLAKGEIFISDDFDAPLPDELLDLFEGK